MNENVNGNWKLFWKEVSKVKGRKVDSYIGIKDGNGRFSCVALMGFGAVTTSEENQFEELRLR